MPSKGDTQINNFVGGLITEASPLSFPPNASFDEINFKLNRDGTRERRLGLDLEAGGNIFDVGLTAAQLKRARHTFFDWPSPGGSLLVHIGVVQAGNKLFFINLLDQSPSAAMLNGGMPITLDLDVDTHLNFTLHNNELIAVSEEFNDILFIFYDEGTDVITTTLQGLKIRDFFGVADGLADDARPIILDDKHHYNLQNQGWNILNIQTTCTISGANSIACTKERLGVYPSNSDQWSLGKIQDLTDADVDRYDPDTLVKNAVNLGRAPKGHFIISPYDRGFSRNSLSGVPNLLIDRELGRIKTVVSYAGRIFYAGIRSRISLGDPESPRMGGMVFFSQVAASTRDATKCYQVADPTSAEDSAIADTDGGIIQITEAVGIVKLLAVKDSLFVFARNGVWQIKGDDGGFRATAFQVNKISAAGTISQHSIVEANGTIFYWGEGGIFSLVLDSLGENYDTKNVTQPTIQNYFNSLPDLTKQTAKGIYDMKENQIRWLFKSDFPKIVGNPIDINPFVPIINIGDAVPLATGIEPKTIRVSNNIAMVIYRSATSTQIAAKLVTVDPSTLDITTNAETILVTSTSLQGMSLLRLTDNRVLLTYAQGTNIKAVVLHIIGGAIFLTATATISTSHSATYGTSPIRSDLISSNNKAMVSYRTVGKTGVQVLEIDSLFNITFGTVATGVSTSIVRSDAVMLDATNGVLFSGVGVRDVLETFTISGTTVTPSGVANTFINSTQIPGTTYSNFSGSLTKATSTTVAVTNIINTTTPSRVSVVSTYVGNVAATAITSTEILIQDSEVGTVPFTKTVNGKLVTVYRKPSGGSLRGRILVNTASSPPIGQLQLDVGTDITFSFPEFDSVDGGLLVIGYETASGVEAISARVVL